MSDIPVRPLAEVIGLRSNLRDVPEMLRRMAQAIEDGRYGRVQEIALVMRSDSEGISVHGYGETSPRDTLVTLALGQVRISSILMNGNATRG